MRVKEDFLEAVRRYATLEVMWTVAAVVSIGAYLAVPRYETLAIALFFAGALLLSVAGVTCAYTIAKENL